MSGRDELDAARGAANGKPKGDGHAAGRELAKLLGLDKLTPPLTITAAKVLGVGADAAAYVTLSDGSELHFRSLREMTHSAKLMAEVVATTGAIPKINQQGAMQAVALLKRYAVHIRSMSDSDEAIEWGINFLQAADLLDLDLNDQAQRWGAFARLAEIDPRSISRQSGVSIAAASVILRAEDGSRLVRTDWMGAYVRSVAPRMTPATIATVMQHVGWQRRGREGRWKATRPDLPGQLNWAFWIVPVGWEDRGEAAPSRNHKTPANEAAVTASAEETPVPARERTRAGAVTCRNRSGGGAA